MYYYSWAMATEKRTRHYCWFQMKMQYPADTHTEKNYSPASGLPRRYGRIFHDMGTLIDFYWYSRPPVNRQLRMRATRFHFENTIKR